MEVFGAEQLAAVASRLRQAGRKDLQQELHRALQRAAKPLSGAVAPRLPEYVPDTYAAVLAAALKIKTQVRTVGRGAGLKLIGTAQGKASPRKVDDVEAGRVKHPLYGNRGFWYVTAAKPGFFTQPLTDRREDVRRELEQAADRVARKIEG